MMMIIDTPALAALLARVGVERVLAELADRTEADVAHRPQFKRSARLASHSRAGVLELMPTADGDWFGFKLVNGHPGNPVAGLLTVTAIGMLAEVANGYPRLVCEMTVLTALRYVDERARALGIRRELPRVPTPGDPKDRYGYITPLVH